MQQQNKQSIDSTQNLKYIWIIAITIIITVLITSSVVYIWQKSNTKNIEQNSQKQISELQNQINTEQNSQKQISELQNQINQIKSRKIIISHKPKSEWKKYFSNSATTTLINKQIDEVRTLFGEPPVLLRSIAGNSQYSREVWIYHPYDEDSTGLYIYFKNNHVTKQLLDEFNGLSQTSILNDYEFWSN